MSFNRAAWLPGQKCHPLQTYYAPMPHPKSGEVVIKNYAVALNPVDWKIQHLGVCITSYPNIMGEDVAGKVYEVGEGVTNVKKGDRVMGHALSLATNNPRDGGFQYYTVINALVVCKIPSTLPYTHAAVLPLSISTAAEILFTKEGLRLPFPSTFYPPVNTGHSVLVWGGSTSVGASAIQLAVTAGVKVVSVCSPHNFSAVKDVGAAEVFDYQSCSVSSDIIAALRGTDFLGVCDCIGTPDVIATWTPVYLELGGRYGSVLPKPEMSVQKDRHVAKEIWGKYIPAALNLGVFKPKPDPVIVKGGLEKVQIGLDWLRAGISFGKLVVEIVE